MGLLSAGSPLDWDEAKKNAHLVTKRGVREFLKSYHRFKNERNYEFKWGDEIEFSIVKFDHVAKRARLSLKGEWLLEKLSHHDQHENHHNGGEEEDENVTFHPEYASYMIESTPKRPFDGADLNCFKYVEDNMQLRRRRIEQLLDADECIMAITNFPRIGCADFIYPTHLPTPNKGITRSYFFPDEAIFKGHPRFRTLSGNIRKRKNKKVSIYVPVFVDKNTKRPFVDDSDYDGNARDNQIYMDATGFGMGCCCLQTTFQAESIDEARHLYDQLTPLTPLLLALTAASPIWRGYLSAVDCRWNVISASVDDRTDEELGEREPLSVGRYRIFKSRYDSIDSYLSPAGAAYNDIRLVLDHEVYSELILDGVDAQLAQHVAHLFIRDSLVLFKERIEAAENEDDMDFFENIQSTNWQTMRFKPPPLKNNSQKQIGWRVEFRPMELQFTDFENAAFCALIILLTQAIRQFNVNFLMPLSKVDVNMQRAQQMNACRDAKFFFRKNIIGDTATADCELVEMTMNEIMNGTEDGEFGGVLALIDDYLASVAEAGLDAFAACQLKQYMKLVRMRAQGSLMTPAAYIRAFVTQHEDYKHDSVVSERINYDLLWRVHSIAKGEFECPELLFKFKC